MMYKKYLAFLKTLFTFHKSELHGSIVTVIKEEMDKLNDPTKAIGNVREKENLKSLTLIPWRRIKARGE